MNQDKSWQEQPIGPEAANEEFEGLRQRFHERLRKEQAQLAALTAVLAGAETASASTFVDLRSFAHRLRGAALVFGFQGIGEGAKAVELAAIAASLDADRQRRDPSVVSTMRALALSLAEEVGTGAAGARPMTHSAGPAGKVSS